MNTDKLRRAKNVLFRYLYLYSGINISVKGVSCFSYFGLRKQLKQFKQQGKASSVPFPITKLIPCYEGKSDKAGTLAVVLDV
jgi:hypothetical protein